MAKCKPTTRAWLESYFVRIAEEYEQLPQCMDSEEWMRDHFSPAHERVAKEIDMIPVDEECGFLGYISWGRYPVNGGSIEVDPITIEPQPVRIEGDAFFLQPDAGPARRFHISALGSIGGYNGFTFGIGGLVGVPLLKSMVSELNDALYFEAGARVGFVDFSNDATGTFLQLLIGARWDVHFTKELSGYVAARFAPAISFDLVPGQFAIGGAVGGHWRFVDALALRVEADGSNYGGSLSAGVTVFF
jgi:hypothetical protein